jgi:hypothetical protein
MRVGNVRHHHTSPCPFHTQARDYRGGLDSPPLRWSSGWSRDRGRQTVAILASESAWTTNAIRADSHRAVSPRTSGIAVSAVSRRRRERPVVHTSPSACGRPLRNGLARRARQRRFGAARGFTAQERVDGLVGVDDRRLILHQPPCQPSVHSCCGCRAPACAAWP